jgi:signal transduction histidine kinase
MQYLGMIRGAVNEVLLIFPTINAIHREQQIGVIGEVLSAVKRGVKIRILAAEDDFIREKLDEIRAAGVTIRRIETPTETKFKLLIVDRRLSLVVETKDDSKKNFAQAIGLAIFSDSTTTVAPYVTIFETLWRETDLYEKTREAERIKDEFVNIAAHELRNPIMPILHGVDSLYEAIEHAKTSIPKDEYEEIASNIRLVSRNVVRLVKLSEDILQVSRIESGTFNLTIQPTNIESIIESVIIDAQKKFNEKTNSVKIVYERNKELGYQFGLRPTPVVVLCDSSKIEQCIFNLVDNAVKFTKSGTVLITLNPSLDEIVVQVRDNGPGIDPQIAERLFGKFVSKSEGGTGLGLYVSKKIIEAHGGRIWAGSNGEAPGATFGFAIPRNLYEDTDVQSREPVRQRKPQPQVENQVAETEV